jgi:hypothetical protein
VCIYDNGSGRDGMNCVVAGPLSDFPLLPGLSLENSDLGVICIDEMGLV